MSDAYAVSPAHLTATSASLRTAASGISSELQRCTTEVRLELRAGERVHRLKLPDGLRVTPSPALMGDLKALLGPAAVGRHDSVGRVHAELTAHAHSRGQLPREQRARAVRRVHGLRR